MNHDLKRKLLQLRFICAGLYFVAVLVCIFLAFDFDGRTNSAWFVLVLLTLPWSIVSLFFMWAIMHGAGLEFFAVMYLTFGAVNTWLLYLLFGTLTAKKDLSIKPPD